MWDELNLNTLTWFIHCVIRSAIYLCLAPSPYATAGIAVMLLSYDFIYRYRTVSVSLVFIEGLLYTTHINNEYVIMMNNMLLGIHIAALMWHTIVVTLR